MYSITLQYSISFHVIVIMLLTTLKSMQHWFQRIVSSLLRRTNFSLYQKYFHATLRWALSSHSFHKCVRLYIRNNCSIDYHYTWYSQLRTTLKSMHDWFQRIVSALLRLSDFNAVVYCGVLFLPKVSNAQCVKCIRRWYLTHCLLPRWSI